MGYYGKRKNRRAQTLRLLVFLFVALMVIPLIMIFRNIFGFESKATEMTDAIKAAEEFKKDYLLALYSPVNNITVCHKLLQGSYCQITMRVPQVSNISLDAQKKYAPTTYIQVEDPPWNATVFFDLTVYGRYAGLTQTSLDVIEPRLVSGNCWNETIDSISYWYCTLNCTSPVKISKIRHYAAGIGNAGGAFIDNISVEQGTGGC